MRSTRSMSGPVMTAAMERQMADLVKIAHDHGLPLIVDASAEEDLRKYVAMGADLVCYSGSCR